MGRLPFVGERLMAQLAAEAEQQREPGKSHGQPGDVLSRLAVSRQLREAVSEAVGVAVAPTYEAVYQYHSPDSRVLPHRDKAGYDMAFHMTLDHIGVIEVFPDEGWPVRVRLAPGEGLVLRGRENEHGWTGLGPNEQRTLITIGFTTRGMNMADNDDTRTERDEDEGKEQADRRLPDLDVTEEGGQAVKGGIPKRIGPD